MPTAAGRQTRTVRFGENNGQTERHRLPGRIVRTTGGKTPRTENGARCRRFRQRVAATGQPAAFQGLPAGLCKQRAPVGKHIQCGRPLRHPFAGREPAQHDYGSHGMRHSLRRLQRGRHSRNDRPPAQRIRGAIQVVRGFCQRHLLDTYRPGLSQPRRAGLPEGRHPLFGKRHR